jgi:glutathione S-transferase
MLKLYGHPVSQPTRAVSWLLALTGTPHEYHRLSPVEGDVLKPDFLAVAPMGYVPVLVDSAATPTPVTVAEAGAIVVYLCESRAERWGAAHAHWYPTAGGAAAAAQRAKVNEWLHWHHGALRRCTTHCFRTRMLAFMRAGNFPVSTDAAMPALPPPWTPERAARFERDLDNALAELVANARHWHAGGGDDAPFLLPGAQPTVADLMSYCELDQLDMLGDVLPPILERRPLFARWMAAMKRVDKHDDVRKPLAKLIKGMKERGV